MNFIDPCSLTQFDQTSLTERYDFITGTTPDETEYFAITNNYLNDTISVLAQEAYYCGQYKFSSLYSPRFLDSKLVFLDIGDNQITNLTMALNTAYDAKKAEFVSRTVVAEIIEFEKIYVL